MADCRCAITVWRQGHALWRSRHSSEPHKLAPCSDRGMRQLQSQLSPSPSPLPQVRPGERGKDTRTPKEREGLVSDPKGAQPVQGRGDFQGTRTGKIPWMSLALVIGIESIQACIIKRLDKTLHHSFQSYLSLHQTA